MTQDECRNLDELIGTLVKYHPEANVELVEKAYHFAEKAHAGQMRKSGEPYFIHPLTVASILARLMLDAPTIAAGLLHDTVEDCKDVTLEIIEREFAKRGIALRDCPEIDGVELPSKPGKRRPVMLDFGNEKGDVFVEFVSTADIGLWKKPDKRRFFSSFSVYDVREAATTAVAALTKRTTGKPVTVGVLYDPIAYLPKDWDGKWEARQAAGRALAEKQLKAQLEGLFAHLAKQGKLPAKK